VNGFVDRGQIDSLRPDKYFSLEGRVALVTGATGGIGKWIAAGLGAAGASIALTSKDAEALATLESDLREAGIEAASIPIELLGDDNPQRLVEGTELRFGRIDVLVNNAAINRRKPILATQPSDFDEVSGVNLRAAYFLSQAVVRAMAAKGRGGSIVNMSSINALMGLEHVSVYGATKAAISQLTKVMALEWTGLGIRANAIAPGFIDTPIVQSLWDEPDMRRWLLNRVPMQRLGSPRELVGLCQLLASDAGSFITGQTFIADGGLLAGGRWFTPDQ
jgi:NAD(P)-dependent dehydrogenase (short-subunit alcohol dehydrogenase family)